MGNEVCNWAQVVVVDLEQSYFVMLCSLLSLRMRIGCMLISSYNLAPCILGGGLRKQAHHWWRRKHEASYTPRNPAGAPYTSYTSNKRVLQNCLTRMSPLTLLACCMLGEMNWPTNVTPNSYCYCLHACSVSLHAWWSPQTLTLLAWDAWCEKGPPLMKKEAWGSSMRWEAWAPCTFLHKEHTSA
jgi:hypothetical protein